MTTITDIAGGHRQQYLLRAAVDRAGLIPLADRLRRETAFPQDDLELKAEDLEAIRIAIVEQLAKQTDSTPGGKPVFGRHRIDSYRLRYPASLVESTLRRVNRAILDMRG